MSMGTGSDSRHSGAPRSGKPGIHNHDPRDVAHIERPVAMDPGHRPLGGPGMTHVDQPRLSYGFIGHSALALEAALGATVGVLPSRFWIAESLSLSFWPFALKRIPGPGLTLSVILVARIASASAFGSAEPARL